MSRTYVGLADDHELFSLAARSIASKTKSDGSQVKESTDSSTTIEDEDAKGRRETNITKFKL